MADWGLIQGLAEGLSAGVKSYGEEKDKNYERALKKRQMRLQELESATKTAELLGGLPKDFYSEETEKAFGLKKPEKPLSEQLATQAPMAPTEGQPTEQPTGMIAGQPTAEAGGLLKIPGLLTKKEKEKQEKLNAYNVQLADKGKRAVYGPGGEIQFIDISTPEQKQIKETKKTKEEVDLERAQTELKIAKMQEGKAGAGLSSELALKSLPKEKQEQIDAHAKTLAKAQTTGIQLDELHKQITDPKLDRGTKLAVANEQVKLLNSSLGADAVGAEEVKRIAAYLDPLPNIIKGMKVGPDLDGFAKQVKASLDRQNGLITSTQGLIDQAYGRKVAVPKPARPVGAPEATPAQKQELVAAYAKEPAGPKKERMLKVLRMIDPSFKGN